MFIGGKGGGLKLCLNEGFKNGFEQLPVLWLSRSLDMI